MKLFRAVDLTAQADFLAHLCGALAQNCRRHLVARLVDQGAGEVLRLAEDDSLGIARLGLGPIGGLGGEEREGLDALILAVGAVGVRVKIAYKGALYGCAGSGVARECISAR